MKKKKNFFFHYSFMMIISQVTRFEIESIISRFNFSSNLNQWFSVKVKIWER